MSGTIVYIQAIDNPDEIVHSYYTPWEEDGEAIDQFLTMTDHILAKEDWDNGVFEVENEEGERFILSLAYIDEFTQLT